MQSHVVELLEHPLCPRRISHDRTLSDLQLQPMCRERELEEQSRDLVADSPIVQASRGEVHRDRCVEAGVKPGAALGNSCPEHEVRQRANQSGVLGEWNKFGRGDQPEEWMMPSDERLDAGHSACREVELRLVEQGHVPISERSPKFTEQTQAPSAV